MPPNLGKHMIIGGDTIWSGLLNEVLMDPPSAMNEMSDEGLVVCVTDVAMMSGTVCLTPVSEKWRECFFPESLGGNFPGK